MRRRHLSRFMLGVFLGMLILVGTGIGFVWMGMSNSGGMGSMTEAVKLRPKVEAMPEPERTFWDRDEQSVGLRFPNGEWVVGVAKDSHALYSEWYGGGTVVLKDSRGRVRCFFGHVCGAGNLWVDHYSIPSLNDFDAQFMAKFTEQPWP